MKTKSMMKNKRRQIHWIMLALIAVCFGSCKDDEKGSDQFDPGKDVVISDFSPKEGGVNTRLILSGENFGTDPSRIKVTIGGIESTVVGSIGNELYCVVPQGAFEGTIEVKLLSENGDILKEVEASEKFIYHKKMLVSTFIGYKDEKGKFDIKDGPFNDCGGISRCSWFSYDPKNPDHLYFSADEKHDSRLIDFKSDSLKTFRKYGEGGMDRMRTITWTLSKDSMIVATDKGEKEESNWVLTRASNFRSANALTFSPNCNGSAVHPVNGELYFNSYAGGQVYRYDWGTKATKQLFTIQDSSWEFNIQIHPSGNFAYIVVINRHYILRTDYDWKAKEFTSPYIVCGEVNTAGWVDGVGKRARLDQPYQGAFVKNDDYAGKEDEYDFYFCDKMNHAIRILAPDGRVTTFAGRGSTGVNKEPKGYINGDLRLEARFDEPEALAYNEKTKTFYVGDYRNNRIRKIAFEE